MPDWIYVALGTLVLFLPIVFAVYIWRVGMKQYYFFADRIATSVVGIPSVGVLALCLKHWRGGEFSSPWLYSGVLAIFVGWLLLFYSLGFIHGLIRRKRNEGIIG